MQKCKWCGFEFSDDLDTCPECGTKVKKKPVAEHELVKLTTVTGSNESDMLVAFLRSYGIDTYVRPESGVDFMEAYFGKNYVFGEDIFVRKEDEEAARELMSTRGDGDVKETVAEEFSEKAADVKNDEHIWTWRRILITVIAVCAALGLATGIVYFIKTLAGQ